MTNWVLQKVVIKGNARRLQTLYAGLRKGEFCNVVLPMPFEHATSLDEGWDHWTIGNWGTKWDVGDIDELNIKTENHEAVRLSFVCNTANTPPLPVWDYLVRLGMRVSAAYADPDMDLYGFYEDGDDRRDGSATTMVGMMLDIDVDVKEYA